MGKFELWSGPPHVTSGPEEATQSFSPGDLLIHDTSGEVEIATDGQDVAGVAIDKATTTTGSDIKYHIITPEQVWSIETSGTPAASMVGKPFDIANFTAGNKHVVNVASAGTDGVVIALDPRDTAASGSRVLFKFAPASCNMWGG